MFALLPLSADEVRVLRERDGIYIDAAGRIKIADLNEANFDRFTSTLTPTDVIQLSAYEIYCGKSQSGCRVTRRSDHSLPTFHPWSVLPVSWALRAIVSRGNSVLAFEQPAEVSQTTKAGGKGDL